MDKTFDINGDFLKTLPTNKHQPSHHEQKYIDMLFNEQKNISTDTIKFLNELNSKDVEKEFYLLCNNIDDILEEELTWNTNLKYIKVSDYLPDVGFQTISNENNLLKFPFTIDKKFVDKYIIMKNIYYKYINMFVTKLLLFLEKGELR